MKSVLEALQVLRSETEIIKHLPLSAQLDAVKECAGLIQARDKLQGAGKEIKISHPPLDPGRVWQQFQAFGFDPSRLNAMEIRTLCSVEEMATDPRFVVGLLAHPQALRRSLCLYGLVNSYFNRWRSMESPKELEDLLKTSIALYPRETPAIKRWRAAQSLFSPDAATRLAEFVLERQGNVANILKLQYVGSSTRLARLTRAKTADLAAKRFRELEATHDEPTNIRYLKWMIGEVLSTALPPGAIHGPVSSLILSTSADKSGDFQVELRRFVESSPALGDPRLRENGPNWRDMDPHAAQRFLSWVAKEYIQFFFNTILPRNDENRRRAEFWLRYCKQIKDFQVAISDDDHWKLKKHNPVTRLPLHSRVMQSSTSAFLMQFVGYGRDFVIVEFSETGHASYIYERSAFEKTNVNLRTPYFHITRHLKHDGKIDRILHQGAWETNARYKLSTLGIRP